MMFCHLSCWVFFSSFRRQENRNIKNTFHLAETSLIIIFFCFQFLIFRCCENAVGSVRWATQRHSEMQMHNDSALIKVNNYAWPVKMYWSKLSVDMPTFFSWEVMHVLHIALLYIFFTIIDTHYTYAAHCERIVYYRRSPELPNYSIVKRNSETWKKLLGFVTSISILSLTSYIFGR